MGCSPCKPGHRICFFVPTPAQAGGVLRAHSTEASFYSPARTTN